MPSAELMEDNLKTALPREKKGWLVTSLLLLQFWGRVGEFTLPDSLGPSEAEVADVGVVVTGLDLGSSGGGGAH